MEISCLRTGIYLLYPFPSKAKINFPQAPSKLFSKDLLFKRNCPLFRKVIVSHIPLLCIYLAVLDQVTLGDGDITSRRGIILILNLDWHRTYNSFGDVQINYRGCSSQSKVLKRRSIISLSPRKLLLAWNSPKQYWRETMSRQPTNRCSEKTSLLFSFIPFHDFK